MRIAVLAAAALLLCACKPQPAAETTAPTAATPANADPAPPKVVPQPALDCRATTDAFEAFTCSDPALVALQKMVASEYAKAQAAPVADVAMLATTQDDWRQTRNDCNTAADRRRCSEDAYKSRLVQLKIDSGEVVMPPPVDFACDDNSKPFTAVFLNELDPKAAVLTWGDDQVIAFPVMSGSGARYGTRGVDFWEHQGEVAVDFRGHKMTCKPTAPRADD